ncbi:hypothetical protein AB4Y45_33525 [Paraburkholderia sp. EG287A]|uniref:hypothetical protein n=1 Tax=Paraburkholderia sp. EG287A TaxID=3237012 RepID=UPI0034D27C3B
MEDLVTKYTRVYSRKDGSDVKIVAEAFFGAGLHCSVGVYVLRRESAEHDWKLCSKEPHPDWRAMSVDEYVKRGRSEMLQAASHGEILAVASAIGKPMKEMCL